MTKSGQTWTPTCLGTSARFAFASSPAPLNGAGKRYGGAAWINGSAVVDGRFSDLAPATRLRDLRDEQRVQDEQERIVFARKSEDMSLPAPATAHIGAPVQGGASGPYPWRRPV